MCRCRPDLKGCEANEMELLQIIYLTLCIDEDEAMGLNRLAKITTQSWN